MRTVLPAGSAAALGPVRARLLQDARAEAEATLAAAAEAADTLVRDAEAEAARILAEAREQGTADAAAADRAERARSRRAARAQELAVRQECWQELCRQVVHRVEELRVADAYPALRARLITHVRQLLGPDARITEAARGGIVGEAPGRRADLGLTAFALRALDRIDGEVEELWTP